MEINEVVRQVREETGMTQKRFAEYFKIPYRTYQDWERGERKMPEYMLRLMAYRLKAEGLIHKSPEMFEDEE